MEMANQWERWGLEIGSHLARIITNTVQTTFNNALIDMGGKAGKPRLFVLFLMNVLCQGADAGENLFIVFVV